MPGDIRFDSRTSLYSILLAAGASSRYGSPKQLACIAGRTMLRTIVESVSRITEDRTILVLGAHASELRVTLPDFQGIIVINPHWSEGIASSLRSGLPHAPATCAGVMVVLADQPLVTSDDLGNLIHAWHTRPESMAAALYNGVLGAPAIFPRRTFQNLAALGGDAGARQLLRSEADQVLRVPMPNARIDIDRPEDMAQIQHRR